MNNIFLNKKWLLALFIFLTAIVILFYNINFSKEDHFDIKLEFIKQYGKPEDSKGEMFGLITSFTIDKYQNIYIADDAFKVIRKFSKRADLIQNYGYGPGKGPGEFSAIHEICIDTIGDVYVLDKINMNLTVFDSLNNLIRVVKLPFIPAQIISTIPMIVDVLGFPFTYQGDLIHRYDLLKENLDKPVVTYCERLTGHDAELSTRSGNSGRLVKAPSGNIYYSFFYPYIIYKFSPEGKYLKTFKGKRPLTAPFKDSNTGMIESPSGIKEFVILPNDILLILIYDGTSGELRQYFDFIDGKNGHFLGSIPLKDLGIKNIRFMRADLYYNIYMDVMDPYPHILKYKISINQQ